MYINAVVIRSTALHSTSTGIATRPQPPPCAARLPADHAQAPVAAALAKHDCAGLILCLQGRPFTHRSAKVRPSQARSVWSCRRASRSRAKSASVLLNTRV